MKHFTGIFLLLAVSCSGNNDYIGRVINKYRVGGKCKVEYYWDNQNESEGMVYCSTERYALELDNNSILTVPKRCPVSKLVYDQTTIGEIFTCSYSANEK